MIAHEKGFDLALERLAQVVNVFDVRVTVVVVVGESHTRRKHPLQLEQTLLGIEGVLVTAALRSLDDDYDPVVLIEGGELCRVSEGAT